MANNIISQRPKIIPPDYGSSSNYSDPFTGESFILPTSAHNTQAKINYDKQKAVRKRTSDLIELDPQTAEAMLLNIGGAWEEGQLREQFRDIRKTGDEAERKKAAQKAEGAAIDDLTDQAKNMYKDEKGMLGYMEKNAGIRNLMKQAYRSNQPTLKAYNELAQRHEEKFFKTQQIGINDGMKLHETIDKIRVKLEDDEAHLSNMLKRRSDSNVDWSDADESTIRKLKDTVVINRNLVNRGEKKLGRAIPENMFELGKRTKKLKNEKQIKNKKTGKEEPTFWQQIQSYFSGDSSTVDLPPLVQRNRSQDTSLTKEQQLALAQKAEGNLGMPTDDVIQGIINEGSLEPQWEQERGKGYPTNFQTEQQPQINLEGTSDNGLPADWKTRQGTPSNIRGGRESLADQFAPPMNLDGTSAQEVTTPVATTPIELHTAKIDESMPMLSDSGRGEVFNQEVVEKETGMGFLDVVESIKSIAVKESPEVAQDVLDGIKGFTNHVVKTATSRDYQRSIIGLRPDEDPDPNQGTPTPSEGGTGFFEGLNMMASSGYKNVAPPVKEKFNWAKEKLKGLTGGFLDWQSRDPSSTGRPSGFSGSREEQFLTPNKKEFNASVLAGDTLSGIEQAYKHGSKIEGMKPRFWSALKRTEGGTEHDSSARGDYALIPRYMTRTPYFENKYGVVEELKKQGKYKISMKKFSQELDNPAINARVAAEFAYINDKALKDNLVTGGWKGMNSGTQERQDWEDLLSATHYLGQTKMESILGELFDADPKKGRGVTMSTLMDYFKNSSEPLVNIAHPHVERFRGYRKEKRKRGR